MAFPHDGKKFQPGESGNPNGLPKGTKHLSTHIQNMLNDERFDLWVPDKIAGVRKYEKAPVEAIVTVAITKAAAGDTKWADWLAKYGYGTKTEVDVTSNGEQIGVTDPSIASGFAEYMKSK